jgi:serine/threonine protein kinase
VNDATGEVKLTGFGIASPLPRERQSPGPPETIAGTLAYMAPKQTLACGMQSIEDEHVGPFDQTLENLPSVRRFQI